MDETTRQMAEINAELRRLRTRRRQLLPKTEELLNPWQDLEAKVLTKTEEAELAQIDLGIEEFERKRNQLRAHLGRGD